jgi:energy-coupling factor transporter ATP-binding protein EcfA2
VHETFGEEELREPPLTVKEGRQWLAAAASAPVVSSEVREKAVVTREPGSLLRAKGLFFAYDKKTPAVMRGLEWSIRPGDRIALFGGNGSGKSTLLQLLCGLRQPQRGEVRLEGTNLFKVPASRRYARIGYLAQNPLLHFVHDTLGEDLLLAARKTELPDPEAQVCEMAGRFGLTDLLLRHPHDLSGGERQLGALAAALLARPQLLLLDEPTKGIDASAKARLITHLKQAHAEGVTLVMATHDVEFASSYANRCSLLFQGEIVADDEPEAFFRGNLFYATPVHRLLQGEGDHR